MSLNFKSEYLKNKFKNKNNSISYKSNEYDDDDEDDDDEDNDNDDDRDFDFDNNSRRSSITHMDNSSSNAKFHPLYSKKGKMLLKIGSRGNGKGQFTWPRGVAIGAYNALDGGQDILVADSSNHRVQVFGNNSGKFKFEFGSYGNKQGEFDCLAGIAYNARFNEYIVSDRFNHRIQVFSIDGVFKSSIGIHGSNEGEFDLPWGVACDDNGCNYVVDKENHRIQVFESRTGTALRTFGSYGSGQGNFNNPHYLAINQNKIWVTDTNNHCVKIFDLSGKVISWLGREGSELGQFKFPRGIAVDASNFIIVADSGNNRIQFFDQSGNFIKVSHSKYMYNL